MPYYSNAALLGDVDARREVVPAQLQREVDYSCHLQVAIVADFDLYIGLLQFGA
jgi:hypothetical protein